MRIVAIPLVILAAAIAVEPAALAQVRAESKPSAKEPGTADLLKKLLGEYVEARAKRTPDGPARAAEIDKSLPDRDWSKVDIPATALDFALDQEQKTRDKRIDNWDFDRLPPALVGLVTPARWATFVEQRLEALVQSSGNISWKSPKAWKSRSHDMVQARAFEKIASHVATGLAKTLTNVASEDLRRFHEAFFRIYAEYDVETIHKSTQYEHLPAGAYMQWGGWLGDRRAMKIASDIVEAWFAAPRETQIPNFDQAVRTIDLFNNVLAFDQEPERVRLMHRIKADPKTPDSVKSIIKTP